MNSEAEVQALFAPPGAYPAHVLLGVGDDAAVLAPLSSPVLLKTDVQVEGLHFRREWSSPRRIGRKALAVNLSDLAAMGGRPLAYVIQLGLPEGTDAAFLAEVRAGLGDREAELGAPLVGGHTFFHASGLFLGITLLGEIPGEGAFLRRSGARPGDVLAVSGSLGGPAAALRALERGLPAPSDAFDRLTDPAPRLPLGALLREEGATACIDVSDGLSTDLHRLASASGVGAVVRRLALPRHPAATEADALHGGEDYELLFTAPADRFGRIAARSDVPLVALGEIRPAAEGIVVDDGSGGRAPLPPLGHDHLRGRG